MSKNTSKTIRWRHKTKFVSKKYDEKKKMRAVIFQECTEKSWRQYFEQILDKAKTKIPTEDERANQMKKGINKVQGNYMK